MTTTAVSVTVRPAAVTGHTCGQLKLSSDRKVSPLVRKQASKDAPVIPNAFGLPAGVTCPGRTEFCSKCYAENLERAYTTTRNLLAGNLAALQAAGTVNGMAALLTDMVGRYVAAFDKALAAGRVELEHRVFRIHWDGDYYSADYAAAWAAVMRKFPTVQFWSYTRSLEYVHVLAGIPNHALYVSVDEYNAHAAAVVLAAYPDVHAAYCATTHADASQLAAVVGRGRPAVCPENVGRLPLVVATSGRRTDTVAVGEDSRGACVTCTLCVHGKRDVTFATSGK